MMRAARIPEIAARILESNPDPVVRLRLQRDVLQIPAPELLAAKEGVNANPWVQQLAAEQHPDGSWGRFHSRDSKAKQKIITTEFGMARGLALGLDASHPLFCRAVDYLTQLLRGALEFPDRPENNDRWPVGVQLFVAASLAQLKPNHPFLDPPWELWAEIVGRTFASGTYDPEAEIRAHHELTGATVKDSYLVLNNKYTLALLSARLDDLPPKLAASLLDWVWEYPRGLGYVGGVPSSLPVNASPGEMDRWFSTHELLAHFPGWKKRAGRLVTWLWAQQDPEGLWNLGPRSPGSHVFPLSANWRKPQHRKFDWTTRVLTLLVRYYS